MAHLTLGWLSLIGASPSEVIDAASTAGFRSVSIRITGRKAADAFPEIVGNPTAMRDLKRRLDGNGLRLSNTSTYHVSPDVTLDMLRPVIDATVELGSDLIVIACTDADHRRWLDFTSRYCELAAEAGVRLALEFVPFSEVKTIGRAAELIEASGAPNLGMLVDSLHLSRSGGAPADIARVDPARIFFAQICDALAERPSDEQLAQEARTGRLLPGDGSLPLYDFLDALPPGIEIECETPVAAYADRSAAEQARTIGESVRPYLARYFESRGRPNPFSAPGC